MFASECIWLDAPARLAATRGINHVNKRDIVSVDIVSSCSELLEFVTGSKKTRFSLYLSAQLMYGLCRIYAEKLIITLREANDLYARSLVSFRPNVIQIDEVRRPHNKQRTDVDIELPLTSYGDFGSFNISGQLMQSQDIEIPVHNLENSFYLQARAEDITLIDASVTPRTHSSYAFGEDFQTEFLSELLGDKSQKQVPDLFQDEGHRGNIDQIAEERESRLTVEQLLPLERPCEALIPQIRPENTASIYDLEQDHQKSSERLEVIREQSEQQANETTTLNQPEASALVEVPEQTSSRTQLAESVKGPSTLDGVQQPELSTVPSLHEGPQIPEDTQAQRQAQHENPQVNEETLVAPSPKRRRVEEKDATTNASNRSISFDLGNAQPCATSSAIRPKMLTPSPRLRIVPQSQLSVVQNPRRPPNRRRGKYHKFLIDEKLQLSKTEMLKNIQNPREILRTRAEYRALGASLMHPRRARSRYPDRLLALPTNFELSISQTLSQMWRAKRQLCEFGRLDEDLLPQKSQPPSTRHSKGYLWSIRESGLESSKEMVRGGVSEISMEPLGLRVSSLALQDQSAAEKCSLAVPSQSIVIPEEQIQQKPQEMNTETTMNPAEELPQRENQPVEPIPEVQIPEVMQIEERHPITILPEAPAIQQPETISGIPEFYTSESALLVTIEAALKGGEPTVDFSRLVSKCTSRKHAATTFHHLLCLLKAKCVRVTQSAPFQPIFISLAES
ncbi:unnamed protein product [Rodentolepis nana]|uniref:Rad21_Rec8_N domain-containing protein n=1 Tax=Rodentolepis nana TaxID=102285 RepID=A0A0R3TQR0_RODNA|nr:unnamed protein product [Rodentolepis nana]